MDETRPPRCRTCEHWGDLTNEWVGVKGLTPDGESWGDCKLLAMPREYEEFEHDYGPNFDQHPPTFKPLNGYEPQIAYAQDGSGYTASLMCRSDFGCVLHSPTNPPEPPS